MTRAAKLPPCCCCSTPGTKASQLKTNLADLKKKWIDAGKNVKTEKIRDIEFSVITHFQQ